MSRVAFLVLLAAAAAGLGGCNIVYSEKPLFKAGDARDGAPLRTGVWVKPKADCALDGKSSVAELPECADPMTITDSALIPPPKKSDEPAPGPDRIPYILARGKPRVMQLQIEMEKGKTVWIYQGLTPTAHDAEGRITAARTWIAQCGKPPANDAKDGDKPRYLTEQLLPGLTASEHNCIARDQKAVRGAVAASEAWEEKPGEIRWVRDAAQ